RYLSDNPDLSRALRSLPRPELSFNYLGQFDHLASDLLSMRPAPESVGPIRSPLSERTHVIEINASVSEGRLQARWTYSENLHRQATIERLAQTYVDVIRTLITLTRAPGDGGYAPSDFPLARVDQKTLDSLFAGDPHIEDIYGLTHLQQGLLVQTLCAPSRGM